MQISIVVVPSSSDALKPENQSLHKYLLRAYWYSGVELLTEEKTKTGI